MKAKKYLLSILCVYVCYFTHGIQAIILSQNNINFAKQWGFDMANASSATYSAGIAAVSTAVAWTGFGKFISVWIGGEISDRIGRKKMMIGGAILYILCFIGFLTTSSALVASICGFLTGIATSGFWDAAGYPAVQEAYPKAPGSALIGIKFFVSLSGMIYPLFAVQMSNSGNWKMNVILPLVVSVICLVLSVVAPFVYDDQKKEAKEHKDDKGDQLKAEIEAAKAAMITKPNKFVVFLVMFYAFLCMSIMYGAQQYTKAFGLAVCGLTELQAAGLTSIYTVGSLCAVIFWAIMMGKLKWNPLKVILIDSIFTAVALLGVLFIQQVAIIYIAIAMLGFFAAGGALQTGLAVVQLFNPGPKGRNTGIYYTFMGAASYLIPVVAAQLTKISGEQNAVYTLMIMLLVFAILAILSSIYLVIQHNKIFGKSALSK